MKHLKLLQNSHKIPSNSSTEPKNGPPMTASAMGIDCQKTSKKRSIEPFGSTIALGMIQKLSTFHKCNQQSEMPIVLPVESSESIIKLEPNLTTFENENNKNGASCPICGKTFSQE